MAKNIELVRQEVAAMRNEVEDFANSAERVGGVVSDVLEYSHEESERAKSAEQGLSAAVAQNAGEIIALKGNSATKAELSAEAERASNAEKNIATLVQQNTGKIKVLEDVSATKATKAELDALNANTGISEYENFSEGKDYAIGDVVKYEGKLYRFTADHAAVEWIGTDVEKWSERKETQSLIGEVKEELEKEVEDVEKQINGDVFFNSVPKMRMNILLKPIPQGSYYILTTDDTSRPYYIYYGTSDSDEYITAEIGVKSIAEKDIFAVYAGFKDAAPSDVLMIRGIESIKEDVENLYSMSGGIKRCEIVPYEKKIDFTIVDEYLKMVVPKDTLIRTFDSSWYVPSDIEVTFTNIIKGTVYFTIYYDPSTHTFGAIKYNERIPEGCFFVCNYNKYKSIGSSLSVKYYTVDGVNEINSIKEDINSIKEDINSINGDIEEIKSKEPSVSDILILNPADSVGQRIIQSYRRTNPSRATLSIKPNLVMSIITDLHADNENLERWFEFNTKYGTYITQQIQLGDIVADKFEDDYTFYTNNANTDNVLCAIGNHDVRKYFEDGKFDDFSITGIEAYEKYLKPFEQKWMLDCVFPNNAASKGFCYYYKDYTIQHDYNAVSPSYAKYKSAGIRVVVTDTNNIDTEQITWLRNALSDAITNKFSVLIFRHYPMGSLNRLGNFNTIDFADYGIPYAPNTANQQMIDEVDNFINNGGEFICWITGDTHYDLMGTLKKSSNEQLIMSFENGGASALWNDSERVRGQKSQDSFNIVSVDTFSKLLKIVRVGNDCDRYLRSKKSIVIRYDNKEIVSEM